MQFFTGGIMHTSPFWAFTESFPLVPCYCTWMWSEVSNALVGYHMQWWLMQCLDCCHMVDSQAKWFVARAASQSLWNNHTNLPVLHASPKIIEALLPPNLLTNTHAIHMSCFYKFCGKLLLKQRHQIHLFALWNATHHRFQCSTWHIQRTLCRSFTIQQANEKMCSALVSCCWASDTWMLKSQMSEQLCQWRHVSWGEVIPESSNFLTFCHRDSPLHTLCLSLLNSQSCKWEQTCGHHQWKWVSSFSKRIRVSSALTAGKSGLFPHNLRASVWISKLNHSKNPARGPKRICN